jgi:hypothetical protein
VRREASGHSGEPLISLCVQAWKKIEETKKKAVEIMKVRQRNKETRAEKEALRAQRENEEREKTEQNAQVRDQQKAALRFNKDNQLERNAREAERLKQER